MATKALLNAQCTTPPFPFPFPFPNAASPFPFPSFSFVAASKLGAKPVRAVDRNKVCKIIPNLAEMLRCERRPALAYGCGSSAPANHIIG